MAGPVVAMAGPSAEASLVALVGSVAMAGLGRSC